MVWWGQVIWSHYTTNVTHNTPEASATHKLHTCVFFCWLNSYIMISAWHLWWHSAVLHSYITSYINIIDWNYIQLNEQIGKRAKHWRFLYRTFPNTNYYIHDCNGYNKVLWWKSLYVFEKMNDEALTVSINMKVLLLFVLSLFVGYHFLYLLSNNFIWALKQFSLIFGTFPHSWKDTSNKIEL